jgi:hypothetical protein
MTLADAMQSGIQPAGVNYGVVSLHLSRFIPELVTAGQKSQTSIPRSLRRLGRSFARVV